MPRRHFETDMTDGTEQFLRRGIVVFEETTLGADWAGVRYQRFSTKDLTRFLPLKWPRVK